MNCKTVKESIIFFIGNDLGKKECSEVEKHLDSCRQCSHLYNEIQQTLGIIEEEKIPETNPFFFTRLEARIENPQENFNRRPIFVRSLQAAMAGILLAVAVYSGILLGNKYIHEDFQQTELTEDQYYSQEYFLDEYSYESIENYLYNNKE